MSTYKKFDYDLRLDGKVAVVTGGVSGIGKAAAEMLLYKGAKVIILDKSETVQETAKQMGDGAEGIPLDLSDTKQILEVVDKVEKAYGHIDILCNIAGVPSGILAEDISKEEFQTVLSINLQAAFFMAQAVGKTMIQNGIRGRIINMGSDAGVVAVKNHIAYSASKAGLLSVTRTLALEWGQYGITCNSISPCVVMTPMSKAYWQGERARKHLEEIPTGRFAEMDEVAAAVAFLASDGAQMINGHNLLIDGGFTIN